MQMMRLLIYLNIFMFSFVMLVNNQLLNYCSAINKLIPQNEVFIVLN